MLGRMDKGSKVARVAIDSREGLGTTIRWIGVVRVTNLFCHRLHRAHKAPRADPSAPPAED